MTVLKPVLKTVTNDILRSILSPSQRYFTPLVASGSMYYTAPTVTLTGDFDISLEVYVSSLSAFNMLLGRAGDNSTYVGIRNDGILEFALGGFNQMTGATAVLNRFNTIQLKRVGSSVTGTMNGTTLAGFTSSSTLILDLMARYSDGLYLTGILANVNINNERFYPINENFATTSVLKNSLAVLGAEEIVNGEFSSPADWTITDAGTSSGEVSGGVLTLTQPSGGGNPFATNTGILTGGIQHLITFDVVSVSDPNQNIGIRVTGGSTVFFSGGIGPAGKKQIYYTSSTTGTFVISLGGAGPSTIVIDNVSAKQADGYGTAQNISSSDFYILNDAGTIWLNQSGGSDLEIAPQA